MQAWRNLLVKLCDPCLSALCVFWTWRYTNIVHTISLCAVLRDRLLYRMFVIAVCQCLNNKRILLLLVIF